MNNLSINIMICPSLLKIGEVFWLKIHFMPVKFITA